MTSDNRQNWVLVISKIGQPTRTVPFQVGLLFGRSSRSSCVIDDPTVSGSHARIIERDGIIAIEDLGSENSTQIPGGPTLKNGQTYPLQPGVTLRLGETFVAVRDDAGEMETASDNGLSDATLMQPAAASPVPAQTPPETPPQEVGEATQLPPSTPAPAAPIPAPPTPTPAASSAPPPSSAPAVPASKAYNPMESSAYEGTIDFGPSGGSDLSAKLAAEGNLRASRARLVIASQVDRRVDSIETTEFTIGRGKDSICRITHPAISTPHASIRFDINEKRFLVQDEDSKNHTYLNGRLVTAGSPHELTTDAHLRFGPVDALFIVEIDPDGVKIPQGRQHFAAKILADAQAITPAQKVSAIQDHKTLGKHIGETLLMAPDPITVKQWTDALEQAKYLEIRAGFERQLNPRWIMIGIAALVLIIALVVLL